MWNELEAVMKKILAGTVIIGGSVLGDILSLLILGTPITDPAIKLIIIAMAWQIWDNVIVPIVEDEKPKGTASKGINYSMKLIG